MFLIKEYNAQYKEKIIELILNIQQNEFNINITREQQPDLDSINEFYRTGSGNFWVAINNKDEIVGTVGLKDIGDGLLVLRKMFVHKDFRGKIQNISSSLLLNAIDWSNKQNVKVIYLGTTEKFLAAHRFYEKNGFIKIEKENLPTNFPIMKVDNVFYEKRLSE